MKCGRVVLKAIPLSARAALTRRLTSLTPSQDTRQRTSEVETVKAVATPLDASNNSAHDPGKADGSSALPSYFDRIHAATGGLDVNKSHSVESARSLVSQAMQSEIGGGTRRIPSDRKRITAMQKLVACRILNDFRLGGADRARELSQEGRHSASKTIKAKGKDDAVMSRLLSRSFGADDDAFESCIRF